MRTILLIVVVAAIAGGILYATKELYLQTDGTTPAAPAAETSDPAIGTPPEPAPEAETAPVTQ